MYGQYVAVDFVEHVRGQRKFGSVDDLVVAMNRDVEYTRELLSSL
ncbi:riboflavin kinase [Nocardia gipuzkoensis]